MKRHAIYTAVTAIVVATGVAQRGFVDRPGSCPAFSCSGRVIASAIRASRRRNTSSRLRLRSKSVGSPVARCRASVNSTSALK